MPYRIEYPIEKSASCRALCAHPFVLRAMQQLLGPSFIPTWDRFLSFSSSISLLSFCSLLPSMVFKVPGEGVPIKWHRDASKESVDQVPAIDVGFYLDRATQAEGTCLWAIPGSQGWPDFLAANMIEHLIQVLTS